MLYNGKTEPCDAFLMTDNLYVYFINVTSADINKLWAAPLPCHAGIL